MLFCALLRETREHTSGESIGEGVTAHLIVVWGHVIKQLLEGEDVCCLTAHNSSKTFVIHGTGATGGGAVGVDIAGVQAQRTH